MADRVSSQEHWIIAELYGNGATLAKIAQMTGRSRGTVIKMLKSNRMSTGKRGPWDFLTEEQKDQCKKDYARGYSRHYLSSVYGVTSERLRNEFEKAGIKNPSRHETGIGRLNDCREEVLHDYMTDVVGIREVARRFGVREGTMKVFLLQHVELKKSEGQPVEKNGASKGKTADSKDRGHGKCWARRTVELALGKKLPKGWVIHHMNESPRDQRHSNLWLFPTADLHRRYHAQQSEILASGGLIPASQTASKNGGLWLPELVVPMKSEPEKVEQLLSCMPESPMPDQQESEHKLAA